MFLLLHTSVEKATRYFNGGRFWQIPSDAVNNGESVTDAICSISADTGFVRNSLLGGRTRVLRSTTDALLKCRPYTCSTRPKSITVTFVSSRQNSSRVGVTSL